MEDLPEETSPPGDEAEKALEEYAAALAEAGAPDPESFLASHPSVADRIREQVLDMWAAREAVGGFLERSGREGKTAPRCTTDAAPPVPSLTKLGDFRILREIGRGGMGVVYLAEQISLRRLVALKVLPAHLTLQADAVERFRREASAAARLHHPGIVQIHAVGEHGGTHFFAMEFVEGTPLDKVLERMREQSPERLDGEVVGAAVSAAAHRKAKEGAVPEEEPPPKRSPSSAWNKTYIETVCRLAARVADALDHAHKAGVLHRDVKPSNILVREDGAPVVSDFGLAREEGLPSMTLTGEFAGTPYYVSPEQAMSGRIVVDHRTDVFSLGVTLYELLTLRRPFEGKTSQEVLAKIVAREPTNPRKFNPLLPRDLGTIVLKAIEKDPERRYATAADFGADLRAFLEYRPIAARPASVSTRILKFTRRHKAAAAGAAALVILLAGTGTWWWMQPGYLAVTSPTKGATVHVDGVARGVTPLARLSLSPGPHRVRIVKDEEDLESAEEEVVVPRGAVKPLDRALPSRRGVVRLDSDPPGAQVTLLGEEGTEIRATEPTPTMVSIPARRYRARFELQGFETKEEAIEVHPGGAVTPCSMRWETGELVLDGFQSGTQVDIYRGDKAVREAPVRRVALPLETSLQLPSGVYSLRARLKEHDRQELAGADAVRVHSGQRTRVPLWLTPLERRFETLLNESVYSLACLDLEGDGLSEIVAGTRSGRILVYSPGGSLRFEARSSGFPFALAASDLDGDGQREVLVATGLQELIALNADGSTRFERRIIGGLGGLALTDSDGDGRSEIVVLSAGPGGILLFSSEGSLLRETRFEENFSSQVAADLDGDGRAEVVLGTLAGRVVAFRVDGTRIWEADTGGSVWPLIAADLDGDGRPEIVGGTSSGEVFALTGDGDKRFQTQGHGGNWWNLGKTIDVADLDGDGKPEIIAGTGAAQVMVLAADGSRRFEASVPGQVRALASADLDGDENVEIVVGTNEGRVLALDRDGETRFDAELRGDVHYLLADDIDGDGRQEIVVATSAGQVLVLGPPRTRPYFEAAAPNVVSALVESDLNRDGRPEILAGTEAGSLLSFPGDASSSFEAHASGAVRSLLVCDLDGREGPELVAGTEAGRLHAYHADGAPFFEAQTRLEARVLVAADFGGRGRLAIVAGTQLGQVVAFSPDGSLLFERFLDGPVGALLPFDVDGDGRDEIVAGIYHLKGAPPDWFDGVVCLSSEGEPRWRGKSRGGVVALTRADLDADGRPEIVGGTWLGEFGLFALNVDGTRRFLVDAPFSGGILSVVAADLDGDGRPEVMGGAARGQLVIWSHLGTRRFETAMREAVQGLRVADLDGDGGPEIVVAGRGGEIVVLEPDGSRVCEITRRAAVHQLVVSDLDGDALPELVLAEGRLVAAYRSLASDPRFTLRRIFLDALQAAERGEEETAQRGFDQALLRWLSFDDSGIGAIRKRLRLCSTSASAQRMAKILERIRPSSLNEWFDSVEEFARRGSWDDALRCARAGLAAPPPEPNLAPRMDALAWSLVDPKNPKPAGFPLALALAESAVRASERHHVTLATLAEVLQANGRSADAIAVAEEALSKCPEAEAPWRAQHAARLSRLRAAASPSGAGPSPATRSGNP